VRFPDGQQVGRLLHDRHQLHTGRLQRQVAGLQPAHHHQVVDQGEHAVGVAADRGQGQGPFVGSQIVGIQAFGERCDRGERRAQLMGDDGEKARLEGGRHRILADRPGRRISTLNYNCTYLRRHVTLSWFLRVS
jgi:hypothetical protein